jgi:exodeoxyribonuclease VII small subunit
VSKPSSAKKTYQQLSNQLAELLGWFESDKVNLDEAIVKYQQALKLLDQMENYLKTAENKIKKISANPDK